MVEQFDPLDDDEAAPGPERHRGGGLLDLPLGGDAEPVPAAGTEPPAWQPRHGRRRRRPVWPWLLALLLVAAAALGWRLWPRGEPAVVEPAATAIEFGERRIGTAAEPLELVLGNGGERPLRVRRLEVVGEAAERFTIAAEACLGRPVAAGESCRVAVEYRPAESGTHRAALRVEARAANSPLELPLTGVAVTPRLAAEPGALEFEPLPVGGRGGALRVRLASVGDAAVIVAAVELVGPAAGEFRLERERCSGRELAAGSDCELRVTFAPAAEGPRRAELRATSDAVEPMLAVPLAGDGLPAPEVALEPGRLSFDEQLVGSRSAPQRLTMRNRGAEPLRLGGLVVSGDRRGFEVAADRCSSRTLAPGGSCTVELRFAPAEEGRAAARVELTQGGGTGLAWRAELAGTGVAPRAEWSAARLGWGETRVGEEPAPRRLRLRNAGTGILRVERLRLGGADAVAFRLEGDGCSGRRLERGESCDVEVGYRASRLGAQRAELTLVAAGASGDRQIELTGTGVGGRLEASEARLEFGSVRVSEGSSRELELTNGGNGALVLRGFSASGQAPQDYRLTGECRAGATLEPEAGCRLVVAFSPLASGARMATLEIVHDGIDSPTRVSLSGAALPPPPAELRVEPVRVDFGQVVVGERSEIRPLTLSNVGRGQLRLRDITVEGSEAGDYRLVPGSCDGIPFLAPGGRCGVGIRFLPAAGGPRRAVVRIRHDAPGGDRTVPLTGSGLASGIPGG